MKKVVSNLLKIQEYEIILEESEILHKDSSLPDLARIINKIENLRKKVPTNTIRRFDSFRKKTGFGATIENNGFCNACHLRLNQGDINRMFNRKMPWICPFCGRYILIADLTVSSN